jgi:hypothetical protein
MIDTLVVLALAVLLLFRFASAQPSTKYSLYRSSGGDENVTSKTKPAKATPTSTTTTTHAIIPSPATAAGRWPLAPTARSAAGCWRC